MDGHNNWEAFDYKDSRGPLNHRPPLSGHKRPYPFSHRSTSSPEQLDRGGFAKLFVGSVPRTTTEQDIRPLFEEQGRVLEVAFIKDKRTGQQQGCCFIKYAASAEADRAIRALHNQYTLPGGLGPIQVRYADGERERLGAVEYKLFVGSLNKQATEKEVEQIFSPYGRVEDVYLMRDDMKQSRGCGFVKYSHRDMAMAAISSLSGKYTMRGCEQPLTVRFADPKRPKPGELRVGGPASGGPGFPTPGIRPPQPNNGEPLGDHNAWRPISPASVGVHGFGNQFPSRSADTSILGGSVGGNGNGLLTGLATPSLQLSFHQVPRVGQQQDSLRQTNQGQTAGGQSSVSQPQVQTQIHATASQQRPVQLHPSSQLAQMLSQQTQTLQASFHSSHQTFTQLQQQLHLIHPSNQLHQDVSHFVQPKADASGANQITAPLICNWTEHTSPDGFKYYYNCTTRESRWEKPEELISYEQQKEVSVHQPHIQAQLQQQIPQMQAQLQSQLPSHIQPQIHTSQQLQQASLYSAGMTGQQQSIQGIQTAQEWMWKNKTSGA